MILLLNPVLVLGDLFRRFVKCFVKRQGRDGLRDLNRAEEQGRR